MLAEVARCLPTGVRPRLAQATLTLVGGGDGALAAAPVIAFATSPVSADDRKIADQIVQAALQCGPYSELKSRAVAVAPDFTDLQPTTISGGALDAVASPTLVRSAQLTSAKPSLQAADSPVQAAPLNRPGH